MQIVTQLVRLHHEKNFKGGFLYFSRPKSKTQCTTYHRNKKEIYIWQFLKHAPFFELRTTVTHIRKNDKIALFLKFFFLLSVYTLKIAQEKTQDQLKVQFPVKLLSLSLTISVNEWQSNKKTVQKSKFLFLV